MKQLSFTIISKNQRIERVSISHATEYQLIIDEPSLKLPVSRWIEEWERGRQPSTLPPLNLDLLTPFQHNVLTTLAKLPYGQTCTYGELAAAIGQPKAARAVGQALNRNPFPLFLPCHRVIGASGKLTGFACGLEIKKRLLLTENSQAI